MNERAVDEHPAILASGLRNQARKFRVEGPADFCFIRHEGPRFERAANTIRIGRVLGWIGKLFGERTAVQKSRENPVVHAAVQESARIYDRILLKDYIDENRRSELARALYLDINRICNSADPETMCRDEIVRAVLELACYQVLVIPPPPEEDPTGLRGQPGVTGELRPGLVELSVKDDDLRSAIYGETDSREFDELFAVIERRYWEARWIAETLNATRIALADGAGETDWYPAFVHAACVSREHKYRWGLELPPAFDESIARQAANAYAVFTDIVVSGSNDPVREWREFCAGSAVPMPDFPQ
jgi:hypothetical protein